MIGVPLDAGTPAACMLPMLPMHACIYLVGSTYMPPALQAAERRRTLKTQRLHGSLGAQEHAKMQLVVWQGLCKREGLHIVGSDVGRQWSSSSRSRPGEALLQHRLPLNTNLLVV